MLTLDELDYRLGFEDDWLNDELDEAIDDFLLFETPSLDLANGFDVITPTEYIAWVQRSLNRLYGNSLVTDGRITPLYRNFVRKFQADHGLPTTGEVDKSTQNKIIKSNESNRSYMAWVHKALECNSVFTDPPRKTPRSNGSYKSNGLKLGIKKFQERQDLSKDGYVGSKTELTLIKCCQCLPPGQNKEPDKPKKKPHKLKIETLTIWLNAFIPNNLKKPWRHVPFAGPYRGQVFLWNPMDQTFYGTDQRLWSKDPRASSRMHSRVNISLKGGVLSSISGKRTGLTVRVDRFGNVLCEKRAKKNIMKIGKVRKIAPNQIRFSLSAKGARNPCVPWWTKPTTPLINYQLRGDILLTSNRRRAKVHVVGAIDEFPSFEMYAAVNDDFDPNRIITLFRKKASDDPTDIIGGAVRGIDVTHELKAF